MLANYILDHFDTAAFCTALELGHLVGVSESTVVRFASSLGYKGYPQFQKELAKMVSEKLNSSENMPVCFEDIDKDELLSTVLTSDMRNMEETLGTIETDTFQVAVEELLKAEEIYVIGLRTCAPLAGFLTFYLRMMFRHVHLLDSNNYSEILEQMVRISSKDVIIGISFPRYSMRTLKALEFANTRNAKIITITDSPYSPMNLYSSCNLIAKSKLSTVLDSLVAPMSVINALIVALSKKKQKSLVRYLEMVEDAWEEYQVSEADEIDKVGDNIRMRYEQS